MSLHFFVNSDLYFLNSYLRHCVSDCVSTKLEVLGFSDLE